MPRRRSRASNKKDEAHSCSPNGMDGELWWKQQAIGKRNSIKALIPKEWTLLPDTIPPAETLRDVTIFTRQQLSPRDIELTELEACELLSRIASGGVTCVEVMNAFCHRASVAHQLVLFDSAGQDFLVLSDISQVNCLSEIFFVEAMSRAAALDEHFLLYGDVVGPLHGLPLSLEDCFRIEGVETSTGYVGWLGKKETAESEMSIVKDLKSSGAIPFVKTNVPMSLLMGETVNNIIGSTCNPYNRLLTAGGAAGGEAALLALRGSPAGMGSDIAGSIRIPSSFNSLYGLRTSSGRLPAHGIATSLPGLPVGQPVIGPMSSSISTLSLLIQEILRKAPWNLHHDVIEMPWRENKVQDIFIKARNGRLRFGLMNWDGYVMPHPPIIRAVGIVRKALENLGHEVINWNPPPHQPATDNLFEIFGSTGASHIRDALTLSKEPPVPQLRPWFENEDTGPSATTSFWELCRRREEYRDVYQKYWTSTEDDNGSGQRLPVDGVILPVAPSAAAEEGNYHYFGYSAIVNVLDLPSGTFPVTFADRNLDPRSLEYQPVNDMDRSVWTSYNPETFHGAPVGLQVMGKRLNEESVIGMMIEIQRALAELNG